MPTPVKHPALAAIGLCVVAYLCVQLLRHQVTLEAAAERAVVTVVVLGIVDRLVVPIGAALLSAPGRERPVREPGRDVVVDPGADGSDSGALR